MFLYGSITLAVEKNPSTCCNGGKLAKIDTNQTCFPINTMDADPIFSGTDVECFSFVRTLTDHNLEHCGSVPNAPAEQITTVGAFLDLSLVYGNNKEQNHPIRAFRGGRM